MKNFNSLLILVYIWNQIVNYDAELVYKFNGLGTPMNRNGEREQPSEARRLRITLIDFKQNGSCDQNMLFLKYSRAYIILFLL